MGQLIRTTVGSTTWDVPAGVSSIGIKCWGAGGGGGGADDGNGGSGAGGGGGAAFGTVTVTPEDTLSLHVGGGGGGGTGGNCGAGGGGGGRTSVYDGSTALIVAGGGGGGGGGDNSNRGAGGGGGGGGNTGGTGQDDEGQHGTPITTGGLGGTQSAGGAGGGGTPAGEAGGTASSGVNNYGGGGGDGNASTTGGENNGGTTNGGDGGIRASSYGAGGGGGNGYYGGGGSGGGTASDAGGAGGGGGSNYISGSTTTNTQGGIGEGDYESGSSAAAGGTVAESGDTDYQTGKGDGGNGATPGSAGNGVAGEDGVIVINWTDPPEGNWRQHSFRGREDNGSETGADWKAAANVNFEQAPDVNFRIRFLVQEEDDQAVDDCEFQLQYNLNSGGWNNVTASSDVVRASASGEFVDGINTTSQIGSGTFVTPNAGMDEADGKAGGASCDFTVTANQETEVEYCVQIRSADTEHNDVVQLRVIFAPATAFDTYSATPSLTIKFPPAWQMVDSTGLTDGEATYRLLTVLSGTFVNGECKDDTNEAGPVNIPKGDFTEFEWCFESTTEAVASTQYEFRVKDEAQKGEVMSQYDKTPKATTAS